MKTRKDFGLIGKVSRVTSRTEHKINQESFLSGRSLGFDNEGRLTLESSNTGPRKEYEYDDNGNLVKFNRFHSASSMFHIIKYYYNTEAKMIRSVESYRKSLYSDFELLSRKEVIFMMDKKSEEKIFHLLNLFPDQVIKYYYQEDVLNRVEKTHYKERSNEQGYTEVELYDSSGRIVEQQIGTTIRKTFEYDNRGNLISELEFDKTGKLESQKSIQYSDDGKIVSKEERNLKTGNNWDYTYKTDTVGNWVEEHSKKLSEVMEQSALLKKDSMEKTLVHDFTRHHDTEKRIITRTINYYD